jgi:hypothetical protein
MGICGSLFPLFSFFPLLEQIGFAGFTYIVIIEGTVEASVATAITPE